MRIVETQIGESLQSIIGSENINLDDPSIYFLLPDIPAIVQAEGIFLRKNGLWGERLLTFGKLSFICNLKSKERRNVISRMGRLFLMEEIVDELCTEFSYFKNKCFVKGFSESLLKIVAELKHAKITPLDLLNISKKEGDGDLKNKLKDLAQVFEHYQNKLERENLIDDIDKLRLLSQSASKGGLSNILPDAKKIVVFGFYDFTPSQLEVLKSVDRAGYHLTIYIIRLDEVPGFRSVVIKKFENWFGNIEIEEIVKSKQNGCRLEINSFPSLREELEFTAREIKRMILDEALSPGDIAIVSRTLANKDKLITSVFERLAVPYSISTVGGLGTSSLGQFVFTLLSVKSSGFERRHFINFLRNPYLAAFLRLENIYEFVSLIELKSSRRRTIRGAKPWKDLLCSLSDNEYSSVVERVKKVISIISGKFNSLNVGALTKDLANVVDELLVYESVLGFTVNEDVHFNCWDRFHSFIKELRYLSKFRYSGKKVDGLNDFITLLQELWVEEKFSHSSPEVAVKVQILDALKMRGTTFPVIFILDLGEKSFPLPLIKDPILKNDERAHINEYIGSRSLYEEFHHYESEDLLFNLIKSSAKKKLYASYSYRDERERSNLPSYLVVGLEKIRGVKSKKHLLEDSFKLHEGINTKADLARHLFYVNHQQDFKLETYFEYLPESIRYVLRGLKAEAKRSEFNGVYSEFEGNIKDTELLPELKDFSPTKLEIYGQCPFRYFARHILNLEKAKEIEDDVSALDLGLFYHTLLKDFFVSIARKSGGRVDLRQTSDEEIKESLREFLKEKDFDSEFGWLSDGKRELIKKRITEQVLPQFMHFELIRIKEWNEVGFFPKEFEKSFDFEIGDIRLSGVVDRVDIGDQGSLVIDYKLRPLAIRKFFDYRNLQLPLYLSACAKQGIRPQGGFFRFLERPNREIGRAENGKKSVEGQISSAEQLVRMYVNLMEIGFYPPVIEEKKLGFAKEEIELRKDDRGPCGWCEFIDLCRVQGGTFRKL
ncbi:exodeoxyribonuclease V subunit gamma [Desulfobacterota bacterium AH_259_B03_O07]|nr:exodeoxyribonuclease V subunit gamma [Desulfobacterota bacterium AH_259_B03_O07]